VDSLTSSPPPSPNLRPSHHLINDPVVKGVAEGFHMSEFRGHLGRNPQTFFLNLDRDIVLGQDRIHAIVIILGHG
jgi:hypothetical protein